MGIQQASLANVRRTEGPRGSEAARGSRRGYERQCRPLSVRAALGGTLCRVLFILQRQGIPSSTGLH